MKYIYTIIGILTMLCLSNCNNVQLPNAKEIGGELPIFPDYRNVTIPCNIAPLNFKLKTPAQSIAFFSNGEKQLCIKSKVGAFDIPLKKWQEIVTASIGNAMQVTIYVYDNNSWIKYKPFKIFVAREPIDSYLVYRRIAPGYRLWGEMGIYERNLSDFEETTFLSNKLMNNNCMNCHSFCMQDPDKMMFHQRAIHAGTYIIINGKIEKLNTKTKETISALVYPSWHPSGKFIAFSTNDIKQDFHLSDPNRIEVFDNKSDVVVYDIEKHEVITSSSIFSKENMETFPTFSPDGKRLYFCSAPVKQMPESYKNVKYNLLSISFDASTRTFGQKVDTIYNAENEGRSAKFPRVSPDGQYLLYTISNYGNFSIWHKDADLRMLNIKTNQVDSLKNVNSNNVESYHSWSHNSRWFVFSSRRENGLYTRPYICYIDKNGKTGKPFLLPQRNGYYEHSLFSFNIPELVRGKVKVDKYKLIKLSKFGKAQDVTFGGIMH
jgi:hypothetical protein